MKKLISVIAVLFFIFNANAQYVPEPGQQVVAGQGKGEGSGFHPSVTIDNTRQNPVPVVIVGGSNGNKNAGTTTKWRTKTVIVHDTVLVQGASSTNIVNTINGADQDQPQPVYSPDLPRFQDNYFVEHSNFDSTGWLLFAFFIAIAGMIYFATRRQVRYDASPVTMSGPSTNPTLNGPVNLQDFRIQSGPGYANCNPAQAQAPAPIIQNFYGAVQTAPSAPEQSTFSRPSSYNITLTGQATPNQEPNRQ